MNKFDRLEINAAGVNIEYAGLESSSQTIILNMTRLAQSV